MISLRMAVAVALQDAGEATRAVELADGLRERTPDGWDLDVTFLSHSSRFEPMIRRAGFGITHCAPRLEGRSIAHDLQWDPPEIVGSAALARELVEGERKALEALRPDVVLHGFWPFGNIAARLLGIRTMCFLPIPLDPASVAGGLLRDLPDVVPVLPRLPRPVRETIVRMVPAGVKTGLGAFTQRRLSEAIAACGWPGEPPRTIFEMLRADLTLVNDLPEFYADCVVPGHMAITGPLFAPGAPGDGPAALDPALRAVLTAGDDVPVIFCTMGSSGTKDAFLEAVRAVAGTAGDPWNAVILASPSVCPIEEARAQVAERPGVVITDAFVPAPTVNALADLVVGHGGQGTVQTALAAGTPIIGVAMQVEQQINLDHVAARGAGIRIPARRWRAPVIREAVKTVLGTPSYRRRAGDLAASIRSGDGKGAAAERMWRHLRATFGPPR
uniref:glycosyltransferase n=1 Tax=Nonomuraea pusilla TaxID=46177 RepID=UPI0007C685FA|nr:nucleotide disphospho-sugar-binding domain-containing protein [Nonomuraea pusilla]